MLRGQQREQKRWPHWSQAWTGWMLRMEPRWCWWNVPVSMITLVPPEVEMLSVGGGLAVLP